MKKTIIISNVIDGSESFMGVHGSFPCGSTQEEKDNTVSIMRASDFILYSNDLHPDDAKEFSINGGLYNAHDQVKPERFDSDYVIGFDLEGNEIQLGNKSVSPRLEETLQQAVEGRTAGIYVPREVYFQSEHETPFCTPKDIEETYKERIITSEEFVEGSFDYIIAPKKYFDATRTDSDRSLPKGSFEGVPDQNMNIYSLLEERFPSDEYELVFVNTGVVEGICRLHTSIGQKQMFPDAKIINISDATTPLAGIGLGYETAEQSRDACERVCKDIGIEYMSTEEFLEAYK